MINLNAILQWRESVHWKELRFVEQDMVISRALISLFQDEHISSKLAFRGGTAIHKLFLKPQVRYSEDLDFVQIEAEPIGRVLDRIKTAMSYLGQPKIKQKGNNNTLLFRYEAVEPQGVTSQLKIEINCREHLLVYERLALPFQMENPWFSGNCDILTYRFDELIGTKIRALYQRKKGRDLYDVYASLNNGMLDVEAAIYCYKKYMSFSNYYIPTATEYAKNLENKISDSNFRGDIQPFLAENVIYNIDEAYEMVITRLIKFM